MQSPLTIDQLCAKLAPHAQLWANTIRGLSMAEETKERRRADLLRWIDEHLPPRTKVVETTTIADAVPDAVVVTPPVTPPAPAPRVPSGPSRKPAGLTADTWRAATHDAVATFGLVLGSHDDGPCVVVTGPVGSSVSITWASLPDPIGSVVRDYIVFDASWLTPTLTGPSPYRWKRLSLNDIRSTQHHNALLAFMAYAFRISGLITETPTHILAYPGVRRRVAEEPGEERPSTLDAIRAVMGNKVLSAQEVFDGLKGEGLAPERERASDPCRSRACVRE